MKTYSETKDKLAGIDEIKLVEWELYRISHETNGTLSRMLDYILRSGGKRLRPTLILKSGQCFGPITQELIKTATAFELIHIASLIHDDIIDESHTRHGVATLNAIWDREFCTLTGDYLFARAYELMVSSRLNECLLIMTRCIKMMCEGEINQQEQRFRLNITPETYFHRIYHKTSCLIESCCKAGAVISTVNRDYIACLEKYGQHIGYAFQIVDDILDFTGSPEVLGKPAGQDLQQGNITLPIIFLNYDGKYSDFLQTIINSKSSFDAMFPELLTLLEKTGALEDSYEVAKKHAAEAKRMLKGIPPCVHRDYLENLADRVVMRVN